MSSACKQRGSFKGNGNTTCSNICKYRYNIHTYPGYEKIIFKFVYNNVFFFFIFLSVHTVLIITSIVMEVIAGASVHGSHW